MKVMIIGGSGMVGHQIYLHLIEKLGTSSIYCTLRKSRDHYKKFKLFQEGHIFDNLELQDFRTVQNILESIKPNVIINCAGLTPRKSDVLDYNNYIEINSLLPHRLSKWAEQNSSRLIHLSTDCVFDGTKGQYREIDIPTAKDIYGKSKFLGEVTTGNSLTLRMPFIGRELEGKTELLEWFFSQKGKSVTGFAKFFYSGVSTHVVAREIYKLITTYPKLNGLYHVSSEPISKCELLHLINQKYDLGINITESLEHSNDKSLNCERYIAATGYTKPNWHEMLLEMRNETRIIYESAGV